MASELEIDLWLPNVEDQARNLPDAERREYEKQRRLTPPEAKFIWQNLAGDWADLNPLNTEPRPLMRQPARAEVLRAFMTGQLLRRVGELETSVRPPSTGVRIRHATFVDTDGAPTTIKLDSVGCDGVEPLPLALESCLFASLTLANARLARLSLDGSRLAPGGGMVDLDNAQISGAVTISEFCADEFDDACCLLARDARIDGKLSLRRSLFRLPAGVTPATAQISVDRITAPLSLERAQIGGGVDCSGTRLIAGQSANAMSARGLRTDHDLYLSVLAGAPFIAEGGILLGGAHIGGNMVCDGAQLSAPVNAILAQSLTINGSLTMRACMTRDDTLRFSANGRLYLHQCRIGGNLELDGALLTAPSQGVLKFEERASLYLRNAEIGGDVRMREFEHRDGAKACFRSNGKIVLDGAEIGGFLHMLGAQIEVGDGETHALSVGGLVAHSDVKLGAAHGSHTRFTSNAVLNFSSANIKGEFLLEGVDLSADMANAVVLQGADIGALRIVPFHAEGAAHLSEFGGSIDLAGANIERQLEVFGARLTTARRAEGERHQDGVAIHARDLCVKGSARFGRPSREPASPHHRLEARGQIDFRGAEFQSDVEILDVRLSADRTSVAWEDHRPALTFGYASIAGALRINTLAVESRDRGVVDLRACQAGSLEDDGGQLWLGRDGAEPQLRLDHFTYASLASSRGAPLESLSRRISRLWGKSDTCFRRERWLRQQYRNGEPSPSDYTPQPWSQAFNAFRDEGAIDDARKIAITKLGIEARLMRSGAWPLGWMRWLLSWPEELLFGFGLSAKRALASTLAALLLGWAGVHYANTHRILVIDTTPIASVVPQGQAVIVPQLARAETTAPDIPCGESINEFFYAVDVFIPLVDLRQESRCQVRAPAPTEGRAWANTLQTWTALKALFSLLGWIMVSMTILTLSGVFRRGVEN